MIFSVGYRFARPIYEIGLEVNALCVWISLVCIRKKAASKWNGFRVYRVGALRSRILWCWQRCRVMV